MKVFLGRVLGNHPIIAVVLVMIVGIALLVLAQFLQLQEPVSETCKSPQATGWSICAAASHLAGVTMLGGGAFTAVTKGFVYYNVFRDAVLESLKSIEFKTHIHELLGTFEDDTGTLSALWVRRTRALLSSHFQDAGHVDATTKRLGWRVGAPLGDADALPRALDGYYKTATFNFRIRWRNESEGTVDVNETQVFELAPCGSGEPIRLDLEWNAPAESEHTMDSCKIDGIEQQPTRSDTAGGRVSGRIELELDGWM